MSKKPINVYWSPCVVPSIQDDWSLMYPKPKSLFSEVMAHKSNDQNAGAYLSCPAVSSKFKKILVIKNNVNCSYSCETNDENESFIQPTTESYIATEVLRKPTIDVGPTILFKLEYLFFADEPLEVCLTPPMFSKPQHANYGVVMPGQFDVGQWFRPFVFEVQMWDRSGDFHLKQDEPIMYLDFKTDRPILLHRFNMSEKLLSYQRTPFASRYLFGKFQTLIENYKNFNKVGLSSKILTEIKNNLIEEDAYKF